METREAHAIYKCCGTWRATWELTTAKQPDGRVSYGWKSQHASIWTAKAKAPDIKCAKCLLKATGKLIVGKFSESVACDARCTSATGPNCTCECGGANHGADHDR